MKAVIKKIEFHKEFETKFGTMYSFFVHYDDKKALYTSKSKDQNKFIEGREAEFSEEKRQYFDSQGKPHDYFVIKPVKISRQSNFGKALVKEKARYSAMAVSYAKDLVVAGKLELGELQTYAWILFECMNEMDKSLEV